MRKTKIDELGRVVIPISFREEMKLESGSVVIITVENNSVVIRGENNVCKRCGDFVEGNRAFPLCNRCVKIIKNSY